MNKTEKLISELCPDGVEFSTVDETCSIRIGDRLEKSAMLDNGKYPVYGGGVIITGRYNEINTPANSITIGRRGTIGFVNFITEDFWGTSNLFIITPITDKLINKFLYYSIKIQELSLRKPKKIGGTPAIDKPDIKKIQIPIPPIEIQKEIVKILDTFTLLEAELEAELEARKKQYEYYRDYLLSFGDDEVEWKELGEVGEFIRGNGLQKTDFVESGFPCIHYGQIYTYYGVFTTKTKSFISNELARKLKRAKSGDVIITNTSENLEDVGKAVVWLGESEVATGGHATIFKSKNVLGKYFAYYTQSKSFFSEKRKYAKGTKVIDVSATDMRKIKIPVPYKNGEPDLEKQQEIVATLDKFDALVNDISVGLPAELKARRQQYEYYRNKLLTFKVLEK